MKKLLFVALLAMFLPFPGALGARQPSDSLSNEILDETVVVGFARSSRLNLTGAVQQVRMKDVAGDRPVVSIGSALQGAIPGLSVSGTSALGQPKSFNIRGVLSINDAAPLILIDNTEADINTLDPDDIESVTVFKDAASSAIYGARAAGGVIYITTRRPHGRQEPAKVNYNFRMGVVSSISNPEYASLDSYLDAYSEAGYSTKYWAGNGDISRWRQLLSDYRSSTLEGVTDNGIFRDTDGAVYYLKESDVLANSLEAGTSIDHGLSVSGAGERMRFRLSGNFTRENGPMVGDGDSFRRTTLSSFVSADVTPWFTQEATLSYSGRRTTNIMSVFRDVYSVRLPNWYPEGYMPASIIGTEEDLLIDSPRNGCLYQPTDLSVNSTPRLTLRSVLQAAEGLSITGEYTFQRQDNDCSSYTGQMRVADASLSVRSLPGEGKDLYVLNSSCSKYNALNVYANYNLNFGGHNLKATLGFNQESGEYSFLNSSVLAQTVPSVPSIQGGKGEKTLKEGISEYATRGVFGRLSWSCLNRYLLEVNGRYDGSSKFPSSNRFGFFPSVSGGWIVSEEPFMEFSRKWLNSFKIRASYGSIGNQNIKPYGYIAGMEVQPSSVWLNGGQNVSIITTPGLIRANYTWESVTTFDVGLNLNALDYRFDLSFDWYDRSTSGMLGTGSEIPSVIGAPAPLQNVSDMRTTGWELALSWKDRIGDFSYRLAFNLYDHISRITRFNNASGNLKYHYEGETLGEIWGYRADGFYSIDDFLLEEARAGKWILREGVPSISACTPKPGDVKFKNLDDDPVINEGDGSLSNPGDREVIGNTTPRFEYGINLALSWHGFDLSILLQGVGRRDCVLGASALFPFGANKSEGSFLPLYSNQTDYWTARSYDPASEDFMVAANPSARLFRIYGQLDNVSSNTRVSDMYLQSGAYLRVKNLTLSYTIPESLTRLTRILDSARVYVTAENLATFCSLPSGYDPESLRWSYPFYRTVAFGASLTF